MNLNKNFLVSLFFLTFISLSILGQSVKITPKKVTYTRPKADSPFKKTFTVIYPIVKGTSAKLAKKIEDSISYQKVMFFSLTDELKGNQWLEEANYDVCYNQKGVLCIYLSFTGIGAFESYLGKYAVVDITNGNRLKAKDVFKNFTGLIAEVKKIQKEEIKHSIIEIKEERKDYGDIDTDTLFEYVDFKRIHLEEFSVNDDGVTFHYNYGFPRIYYPLEPAGSYFMSWNEIKPFIKRDSLLVKFIR